MIILNKPDDFRRATIAKFSTELKRKDEGQRVEHYWRWIHLSEDQYKEDGRNWETGKRPLEKNKIQQRQKTVSHVPSTAANAAVLRHV